MKRVGIVANQVAAAPPQAYDLVIRNGTIFDGLRTPRFVSDVGIREGKVAVIGRITKGAVCKKEIDATGLNVCPGFVDLHTHYDAQVFWDPYLTIGGWHGVTSVVIGNCGFGYAPCKPTDKKRYMQAMERNEAVPYEAQEKGMPFDWETFPEYLDSVDRTPKGVNVCSYFGLNPVMFYVMGEKAAKSRAANKDEMETMKGLLREAMEAGACGFSAQVLGQNSVQRDYDGTPMATDTMSKEDLYEFGSVLSEIGRGFIQVAGLSFKTTENLAKASGRPILYNAVTVSTDQHGIPQQGHNAVLSWLDKANKTKGLRIFGQAIHQDVAFNFTLEDYNLFDSSKPWREITLGSVPERMARMQNSSYRQAVIDEYKADKGPFGGAQQTLDSENGNALQGWLMQLVKTTKPELKKFEGMKLDKIAEARGQNLVEAFLDVSLEDDLKVEWTTNEREFPLEEVKKVMTGEFCVPGVSDGGAHTKFLTLGTYSTRFLLDCVRDTEMMSLEDAHWKLARYPAQAAGLLDRGMIAVGMPADILVYDLKNLKILPEEIAYDFPGGEWRRIRKADGYKYTIVNGEVTFEDNQCTGATPGKLLRHGRA